jgi:hypothetical protein
MRIEQQSSISKVCAPFKSVDAMYATHLVPKAEYEAMALKIKAAIEAIVCERKRQTTIDNLNKNGIHIN